MQKIRTTILIAFVCLFGLSGLRATHIVGGDIHYVCNGGNEYTIILKVYRDCFNGVSGFDDPASVGVFDQFGNLVENIEISLDEAVITVLPVELNTICLDPPDNVCVQECRYEKTVVLDVPAGGLNLAYQRCCRNTSIVNTASNDDIGMTVSAFIPDPVVAVCNSNPTFVNYPPIFICMNAPFEMDHSAIDEDGDQLVYSFCNPLLENVGTNYINPPGSPPYPQMPFYPEFNANYPIASDPAFEIDPATGLLTGTPNALGQYVVGICVEEYRNGVLLSSTNRDFQFNVTFCNPNSSASIPAATDFCAGAEISFNNNSTNAANFHWDFGVDEVEDDTSNVEFPTFTYPEPGIFTVTLVINAGELCADTAQVEVGTFDPLDPVIEYGGYECIDGNDHYGFLVNDNSTGNAQYLWDFGFGSDPPSSNLSTVNDVAMNENSNQYQVSVIVTENGCTESAQIVIDNPEDPVAAIVPQDAFCEGFTYNFENSSSNAESYLWDFDDPFAFDQSGEENPQYTFSGPGEYFITLVATTPFTCPDTASLPFEIFADLNPSFEAPAAQCLTGNSFDFIAEGATDIGATYEWFFGPDANITTVFTEAPQNISFNVDGWQDVVLTISEHGCTESYIDSVLIIPNFINEFSIESESGCPPALVNCFATTTAAVPVYYLWDFGDGTTSNQQVTSHEYSALGTYDIQITAFTLSGCVESESMTFSNAISVLPAPSPGFTITPQVVDITNPVVQVSSVVGEQLDCFYYMSDGGESDDCEFSYTWTVSGTQTITQVVTDANGCSSAVTGEVIINGYSIFVPNSFTPDNDGVNDIWMPKTIGVTEYHVQIFDRWGDLIFESDNPETPWIGDVHDGDYYAADGIYVYHIEASGLDLLSHEYTGHIVLIR